MKTWSDCLLFPKEWIGVEMDQEIGTHDGSLFGVRYFTCTDRHGVFAQATQLEAA